MFDYVSAYICMTAVQYIMQWIQSAYSKPLLQGGNKKKTEK